MWSLHGYVTANGFDHSVQTHADPERKQSLKTSEDKDCTDFRTQKEAQAYFEAKGGSSSHNADQLDGSDQDGIVCESLP
ncbi:excalibur calcium-binding domain-containing protein [Thermoflavimicrobium dichotomicum]|uniref:excalibur calcium-binding domain-containing protein n=1 Tax=Thermoflavimicrobium dichotomicum TaxID=46223 RepID=UPI000B8354B3